MTAISGSFGGFSGAFPSGLCETPLRFQNEFDATGWNGEVDFRQILMHIEGWNVILRHEKQIMWMASGSADPRWSRRGVC